MTLAHKKYFANFINVPSHVNVDHPNLKLIFPPPNTTARTQPLDLTVFGVLKNQYNSWLMRETLQVGPENLKLETCVKSMANIFKDLDVRSSNHGFSSTGLSKFQSEPILETELTQNERILNLIESFDKFACSDSDSEQVFTLYSRSCITQINFIIFSRILRIFQKCVTS